MAGQLAGKVAVITGGGSGIGAAIAAAFHAEGARVVIADVSGAQEEVAKRLGEGARAVHADVSSGTDVQAMLQVALDEFGRLDVVCNNAGIGGVLVPLGECSEENYDRIMGVNARGVFLGMRYALPILLAGGGGSIVNIASIAGNVAFPTMSPYCASKGAILAMSRTAAAEYAAARVRINCICPGVVHTPLTGQLPTALMEGATALTPMGRGAQPHEIAGAAVYLASDAAGFVTGSAVTIDGGYTAL